MLRDLPHLAASLAGRAFETVRQGHSNRQWHDFHAGLAAQDNAIVTAYDVTHPQIIAVAEPEAAPQVKVEEPEFA